MQPKITTTMIKVRFPNESVGIDIPIDKVKEEFTVNKIYDDTVFGWLDNIYVNIPIEDYNKIKKLNDKDMLQRYIEKIKKLNEDESTAK